jgi:hypothetical protein
VSINSKANIGVGAFGILAGAVFLRIDSGIWGTYIGLILLGTFLILNGISFNLDVRGQQAIRGLCYGFVAIGLVFLVVGLVSLVWS